jgi:hypothetical protein
MSGTPRRHEELVAKKRKVVDSFFAEVGRDPGEVIEFRRRYNPRGGSWRGGSFERRRLTVRSS